MINVSSKTLLLTIVSIVLSGGPTIACAIQWMDLWQTPDQQGMQQLKAGNAAAAMHSFIRPDWKATAAYRAKEYASAFTQFSAQPTSNAQYNAGNAAAYLGNYEAAIKAYDKAIALNSNNVDAIHNRDIVKKLLKQKKASQANKPSSQSKEHSQPNPKANQQTTPSTVTPQEKKAQNDSNQKRAENDKIEQAKEEAKQQIFRRLTDEPGSLLQRKFLRDYLRRHTHQEDH